MTVTPMSGQRACASSTWRADLGLGHAGIVLEGERRDRRASLRPAADAGEGDDRADVGAPGRGPSRFRRGVEVLALQANGR